MHEISPVLAGTFDAADYAPAVSNVNQPAGNGADSTSSTSSIDPRRYTKWDKSATEVNTAGDFTFDDFLDMINPLEHIPVLSSIYRGITNENINPVSRVAGDIMYGGMFGIASAVMGGLSSAADSMVVAETGHDMSGYVLASILGTDDDKKDQTQVAQNNAAPAPAQTNPADPTTAALAALVNPAAPDLQSGAVTQAPLSTPATDPTATTNAGLTLAQAKAFPLNVNKLPYGGAMAPPNTQAQNAAIALSESSHAMRMGNMIYTNPLMNGPHPLPIAAAKAQIDTADTAMAAIHAPATAPAPAPTAAISASNDADTAIKMGPQKNPIPQNLIDDMVMLRALNQYKGVASGGPSSGGTTIDLTN